MILLTSIILTISLIQAIITFTQSYNQPTTVVNAPSTIRLLMQQKVSVSVAKRYQLFLMVSPALALKWLYVYLSLLIHHLKAG